MNNIIKTAECVSPKHPDKMCDIIADSILDAYMKQDPFSRVAIEVMGGHGRVNISGEVTSNAKIDIAKIVSGVVGKEYDVLENIVKQSNYIAQGVDTGGAGDQGIMIGYATRETASFMPKEYEIARSLCKFIYDKFPYDGKTQVTTTNGEVSTVVASFQNTTHNELFDRVKQFIDSDEYLINPAGDWLSGGFDADSGLSGRKLIVDNYGPEINIGGGSFSGKDWTKVDRSGAYMARRIAIDSLTKWSASKAKVRLAYAIGKKEPVMSVVEIDGGFQYPITGYDLSPKGIYEHLNLKDVIFAETATWGHFGRDFSWG